MLERARLAGKVIVDPTNPVGPDGDGGYRKVIGERESSGQILAGLVGAENSRCLGVCAEEA
jgi:8-hydroxy-5-deazaflavin:NADPH oxidoreductase